MTSDYLPKLFLVVLAGVLVVPLKLCSVTNDFVLTKMQK